MGQQLRSSRLWLMFCLLGSHGFAESRIINGVEVSPGEFPEVVSLNTTGSHCTATIVGERAVLTAAHCTGSGPIAKLWVGAKSYVGTVHPHPLYPAKDYDLSLVITDSPISEVAPVSLGGPVGVGEEVFHLGYGCTQTGGAGGIDGKLRIGSSEVSDLQESDIVSRRPDGAALCFGDSGGPTYRKVFGRYILVGVGSKGNIKDTNYSFDLNSSPALEFLTDISVKEKIGICGLNMACAPLSLEVPEFKSAIELLRVSPRKAMTIPLVSFLKSSKPDGSAPSGCELAWTLDSSAPVWMQIKNGTLFIGADHKALGLYSVSLTVSNALGVAVMRLEVEVAPESDKPDCTLSAKPQFVHVGESVTLTLSSTGVVTAAAIDGTTLPSPGGSYLLRPSTSGIFVAQGWVRGPGGEAKCVARYGVK